MLTLHHLETSRSSRIIWLLEALDLPYELITHKRGPDRRSMADLKAIHPLGKAPALIDGDLLLVESGTILRYVADKYGSGRFQPPPGTAAHARHDEWLDYAESSLMGPVMMKLFGLMGGGLPEMLDGFASGELTKAQAYVEAGVADTPFVMGDEVTLADMQMSYCLAIMEAGGMLRDRAGLVAYWTRIQAHPGYQRAVEVGGPLVKLGG